VINYDAGAGHTVITNPWNGVSCKLAERNESDSTLNEYVSNDASAIGQNKGIANVTIDISGATATENLDAGHYYELVPVFRSSYDPGLDVLLSEPLSGITIKDSVEITLPGISLDDPSKYTTTEYPNTGTMEVVVNYVAGNPYVVLDSVWKGVCCILVEKDENNTQVNEFLAYDESTIGQDSGVISLSIDISGATPTALLDSGHYYELIPVFRSSYDAQTDVLLEERVLGITIIDTTSSNSVFHFETTDELIIYPNPAGDFIYIGDDQVKKYDIRVSSLQGELLIRKNNVNYLNIQSLSDGVYILRSDSARKIFIKGQRK
jgi:hypothetical protein